MCLWRRFKDLILFLFSRSRVWDFLVFSGWGSEFSLRNSEDVGVVVGIWDFVQVQKRYLFLKPAPHKRLHLPVLFPIFLPVFDWFPLIFSKVNLNSLFQLGLILIFLPFFNSFRSIYRFWDISDMFFDFLRGLKRFLPLAPEFTWNRFLALIKGVDSLTFAY